MSPSTHHAVFMCESGITYSNKMWLYCQSCFLPLFHFFTSLSLHRNCLKQCSPSSPAIFLELNCVIAIFDVCRSFSVRLGQRSQKSCTSCKSQPTFRAFPCFDPWMEHSVTTPMSEKTPLPLPPSGLLIPSFHPAVRSLGVCGLNRICDKYDDKECLQLCSAPCLTPLLALLSFFKLRW